MTPCLQGSQHMFRQNIACIQGGGPLEQLRLLHFALAFTFPTKSISPPTHVSSNPAPQCALATPLWGAMVLQGCHLSEDVLLLGLPGSCRLGP